jgi:hypothetical protein
MDFAYDAAAEDREAAQDPVEKFRCEFCRKYGPIAEALKLPYYSLCAACAPVMREAVEKRTYKGVTILTEHVYPPIPIRSMDWSARTARYEVCCEECGANEPSGEGPTEIAAIVDLIERLEEL